MARLTNDLLSKYFTKDTGYIYFVDGEPVTNPRQLIEAIEKNRKIISVNPTQVKNKI